MACGCGWKLMLKDTFHDGPEGLRRRVREVEERGHHLLAVLVGACREDVAPSGRCVLRQLAAQVGHVGDAHGAEGCRQACDVVEVGWVDDRLRVLEVRGDAPLVGRGKPNVAVDESSIDVIVGVAGEFLERGEHVVERADVGAEETAPRIRPVGRRAYTSRSRCRSCLSRREGLWSGLDWRLH